MFGKKKRALLTDPEPQPLMSDNVTQFMEKLGLSPDEIAEMANPVSERQRTIDEAATTLEAFVAQTNAASSSRTNTIIDLVPYRMLPEPCWELPDRHDQTLLTDVLGLLPAQPWNILLLAGDEETANLTGAARYPHIGSDEHTAAVNVARLSIIEELERVKTETAGTLESSSTDRERDVAAARDAAATRIIAMARPVAAALLGQDVVDHSRSTFFDD